VGREATCLLFFTLFLRLAFVFPGIVVGTQGFVHCVCCVGAACCIVSSSSIRNVHLFCCTIKVLEKVSQQAPGRLGAALRHTPLRQPICTILHVVLPNLWPCPCTWRQNQRPKLHAYLGSRIPHGYVRILALGKGRGSVCGDPWGQGCSRHEPHAQVPMREFLQPR
jgi:hypothetical protein